MTSFSDCPRDTVIHPYNFDHHRRPGNILSSLPKWPDWQPFCYRLAALGSILADGITLSSVIFARTDFGVQCVVNLIPLVKSAWQAHPDSSSAIHLPPCWCYPDGANPQLDLLYLEDHS